MFNYLWLIDFDGMEWKEVMAMSLNYLIELLIKKLKLNKLM